MTSQGFSFPPPPPPPPQQSFPTGPTPPYGQATSYGPRGGRGAGGHHRGRGRGYGNRGGRGGYYGPSDPSHTGNYHANAASVANQSYSPVNYGAYPPPFPAASNHTSSSPYNATQSSPYQAPHAQPGYAHPQPYSGTTPYSRRPSYDAGYGNSNQRQPQSPPYGAATPSYVPPVSAQQAVPVSAPVMGPPLRWGFEDRSSAGYTGAHRGAHGPHGPRTSNAYNQHGTFPSQGQKRPHASAFGKAATTAPRVPAPPAVPSFGNPLPSKPPPAVDATRKPKKKKRRHNQLGLTPKTEEHESSEEEDDVDEEAKLAQSGSAASLQFTYKGRISTLQSQADIAAWIEERKKRFPTQQRVEERKKVHEEAQRARNEALKQKQKQREEAKQKQKEARAKQEQAKEERKAAAEGSENPMDAAAKARQKADKLRRKLMKEEKRAAKAEADAERARLEAEALKKGTSTGTGTQESTQEAAPKAEGGDESTTVKDVNVPQSSTETAATPHMPPEDTPVVTGERSTQGEQAMDIDGAASMPSPEMYDTSDETSSSGSDLSSDDSSESGSDSGSDGDSDSAPEEVSSRRDGPERVPPPPREAAKKKVCRHFLQKGRCSRGDQCRFSHDVTAKAQTKPAEKKAKEKAGRKGLLQALLAREREDEDRRVMQTIMWLGEHGMLDTPDKPGQETTEAPKDESAADLHNLPPETTTETVTESGETAAVTNAND
ncbi:CCCH zinc finger protein [Paecilomyces variotii No. 5]|uniref:CCCH zinc finger protein n=1 Tax=Byssochlamys spectabilis (strain No. 5 / NBRC 109023) TaxID=1356009 RepID=V5FLG3_BYSSN|nr:CCCH zinc finger protein [Paecilomyces variotii No. 5]